MRRLAPVLGLILLLTGCAQLRDIAGTITSLTSPITLAPETRLAQAVRQPDQCLALLREEGVAFTPARDQTDGEFCVVTNALLLGPTPLRMSPERTMMNCPLAAAVLLWARHSVEPAAREILGAELTGIEHYGAYACRRVYGQETGRVSAHARAQALDVATFRFLDGRLVNVLRHWGGDGPEGRFLRRVRDDACRVFGSVLSPDYNLAHANHLHLEYGGRGPCS